MNKKQISQIINKKFEEMYNEETFKKDIAFKIKATDNKAEIEDIIIALYIKQVVDLKEILTDVLDEVLNVN